MELVKGIPLTDYCDEARLDVRARLALFVDLCHAIQHAHQRGLIHRDLKPSNVLVTLQDGKPLAKVIDFGVAKALGQQLTRRGTLRKKGQRSFLYFCSGEPSQLVARIEGVFRSSGRRRPRYSDSANAIVCL